MEVVVVAGSHDMRPHNLPDGWVVSENKGTAVVVVLEVATADKASVRIFEKFDQVLAIQAGPLKTDTMLFKYLAIERQLAQQHPPVFHTAKPQVAVAGLGKCSPAFCIEAAEKKIGGLCGKEGGKNDTKGGKDK